jgi:hypothetical protein
MDHLLETVIIEVVYITTRQIMQMITWTQNLVRTGEMDDCMTTKNTISNAVREAREVGNTLRYLAGLWTFSHNYHSYIKTSCSAYQ